MSFLLDYTHIINPRLKHIYLTFDARGNLIIKSPKVSQKKIEQLVLRKATWINISRKRIQEKKGRLPDFTEVCELYFLGKSYPLMLVKYDKKRIKLHFTGEVFTLFYHTYNKKLFLQHIDNFYKKKAKEKIPSIANTWSESMGLKANKFSFRKTKRQWGSCSAKNNISFNTMIMKLPLDVIQYIIVHELAHIRYKHHQKSFWELVSQYLPGYKTQVKELKKYTTY